MRKGIIALLLVVIMFGFFGKEASASIYHESLNNVISLVDKVLNGGSAIMVESDEADSSTITHFGNMQYDSAKGELKLGKAMIFFICALILGLIIGGAYFIKTSRQRHLDKEQGMLKALIDNIPDTIYFKDLESKFTRVNKAQAKLLGLKHPDDAIGKSDFDFFEHAQKAYEVEQEIIRTRTPVINQIHKVEKQGKVRFLSDTKIPLIINDKCIGTVGITHDITDVKQAEDVMLESQAKFKALFENAPLAFFRLDKDMKVVEFNHRFRKMFGYTDDDIGKVTKYDLLVDAEIGSLILDTILETKEVTTEIMLKRKNGESFIANLTLALLEEGFKEIAIEGIVEDITQVAKARDELIKAKDKAIEADRLKSLFLANMSHEIRTPMNAIIGFTNMLREDDLSSEDRNSFIDVIQSNGNSLMSLIESLVDFSKLEADQMSVSMGEFNLNPLLESACDNTEKLLKSEEKVKVKVIRSFESEDGLRIVSDRHRLNQVLSHLLSNAIKFTDEGEIEIGYKVEGEELGIFVRDTGIGIQKDKIGKIFDRFTKVSSDKNKLYGGTGIGLTISKGLMELMGGKIEVESKVGEGSTFWLNMKTGIVNEQA